MLNSAQNAATPYHEVESTPTVSLSAFDGESVAGVWTLTLCDVFAADEGTIDGFYLHIDGVPATDPLIVTSTADTNSIGTLLYAINHVNSNAADDDITFNISGTGPHTITLTGSLPALTDDGISIDRSTQALSSCEQLTAGTAHDLRVYLITHALGILQRFLSGLKHLRVQVVKGKHYGQSAGKKLTFKISLSY